MSEYQDGVVVKTLSKRSPRVDSGGLHFDTPTPASEVASPDLNTWLTKMAAVRNTPDAVSVDSPWNRTLGFLDPTENKIHTISFVKVHGEDILEETACLFGPDITPEKIREFMATPEGRMWLVTGAFSEVVEIDPQLEAKFLRTLMNEADLERDSQVDELPLVR